MGENSIVVGFRGRNALSRAMSASARASANPSVRELADGSLVGAGDTILRGNSQKQDVRLYGARGTSCWASELEEAPVRAVVGRR